MNARSFRRLAVVALAAGTTLTAGAGTTSVVYSLPSFGAVASYLVDWNSDGTMRLSDTAGSGTGTYTDDATQRLATMDTPISAIFPAVDCNGNSFEQRWDYMQFVFRPTSVGKIGTADVVEIGTITDLGGCTPGRQQSFGSPGDPGFAVDSLNMKNRASESDLVPGARLAAFSDAPADGLFVGAVKVVTFGTGTLTFDGEDPMPYAMSDGWIVFALPDGSQRAYTRLKKNARGGLESWLVTAWANGQPAGATYMTPGATPNAKAGFGDTAATAHDWQVGLWLNTELTDFYDLYTDFSGDWLTTDNGVQSDVSVTWSMQGNTLWIHRPQGTDSQDRSLVPVADYGNNHFVLETIYLTSNGVRQVTTPARVNWFIDRGPSTPPASPRR
jgi:hypothetical protein